MPIPESKEKYSYADYLTWPEGERWEIIDGVPYLQAAPSPVHQEILMELSIWKTRIILGRRPNNPGYFPGAYDRFKDCFQILTLINHFRNKSKI
jgi:hypothetical protein